MSQRLVSTGKVFVSIAAIWALGASLYIFFSTVSVHGVSGVIFRDSGEVVQTISWEQSWYEAQGLWGVSWLILFSMLYLFAARVAWRGNIKALTGLSVTALVLSIVTGFSIGGAYFPAALCLLIGTLMFFLSTLRRAQ